MQVERLIENFSSNRTTEPRTGSRHGTMGSRELQDAYRLRNDHPWE